MSKKKKVSKGNPAAVTVTKTRGGWKPSSSLETPAVASNPVRKRKKKDWKKVFVVSVVVILAGVFAVTSVISTAPLFPDTPAPYNAPNVIQSP